MVRPRTAPEMTFCLAPCRRPSLQLRHACHHPSAIVVRYCTCGMEAVLHWTGSTSMTQHRSASYTASNTRYTIVEPAENEGAFEYRAVHTAMSPHAPRAGSTHMLYPHSVDTLPALVHVPAYTLSTSYVPACGRARAAPMRITPVASHVLPHVCILSLAASNAETLSHVCALSLVSSVRRTCPLTPPCSSSCQASLGAAVMHTLCTQCRAHAQMAFGQWCSTAEAQLTAQCSHPSSTAHRSLATLGRWRCTLENA